MRTWTLCLVDNQNKDLLAIFGRLQPVRGGWITFVANTLHIAFGYWWCLHNGILSESNHPLWVARAGQPCTPEQVKETLRL